MATLDISPLPLAILYRKAGRDDGLNEVSWQNTLAE